jgi:murein DD-endopeptidase MepM/ murein hydrolase activator NlpD
MRERIFVAGVLCTIATLSQVLGQIVEIPRDESVKNAQISADQHEEAEDLAEPAQPADARAAVTQATAVPPAKAVAAPVRPAAVKPTVEQMRVAGALAAQRIRNENRDEQSRTTAVAPSQTNKIEPVTSRLLDRREREQAEPLPARPVHLRNEMAFIKLAEGFDFPVGKPDAQGYYKARGFRPNGHLGEDWDGVGGGDTDLGDPIYSIGDGVVVFARDCHMGWGNVVIVRHVYRDAGFTRNIDSLYAHLEKILVRHGQSVRRGQQIATLGNAHGLYDAHLHFEIRKNIEIGMSRAKFAQDFSNYYDPTKFILSHRHLQGGGGSYRIALNTFTRDARIRWEKLPDFSHAHTGRGSSESAAALKKAVAAENALGR